MTTLVDQKTGRQSIHKDIYRRRSQGKRFPGSVLNQASEDVNWEMLQGFVTGDSCFYSDLNATRFDFKVPAGNAELSQTALTVNKNEPDCVVHIGRGASGALVFSLNDDNSLAPVRLHLNWNAASNSRAVTEIIGGLRQKMASRGTWIDAEAGTESSKSFHRLYKAIAEPSVTRLKHWLKSRVTLHQTALAHFEGVEEGTAQWICNSKGILHRLESLGTNAADRITAVLFAETTAFTVEEKPRMLDALFTFIQGNRFSIDERTVVAVGSAVRKFAMNMPAAKLDQYAQLFVPSATESISCRIELELAKGASWRLAKLPSAEGASAKQLETRLAELASDYLAPRLILQKNYASIALAATVGVILMNGEPQEALLKRVHGLRAGQHEMNWFRELLADRLTDIAGKQVAVDSARADRLRKIAKELDGSIHY